MRHSAIDIPEKKPYGKIARVGVIDRDAYAAQDASAYDRYGRVGGGYGVGPHGDILSASTAEGSARYGAASGKAATNDRVYLRMDDVRG